MADKTNESPIYSLEDQQYIEFFAEKTENSEPFVIKCYRVSKHRGKIKKTWLEDFEDYCPSENDIAEDYGGGTFWFISYHNKRKLERYMYIDDLWTDRLPPEKRRSAALPPPTNAAADPLATVTGVFKEICIPLMESMKQQNQQPAGLDVSALSKAVVGLSEQFTDTLLNSLDRVQASVIERKLDSIDPPRVEVHQPEKEERSELSEQLGDINEIMEIVKEWADKLLTATGLKKKMYDKFLNESEEIQAAKEDPDLREAIYSAAVSDPEIGKEKADALFEKLGLAVE